MGIEEERRQKDLVYTYFNCTFAINFNLMPTSTNIIHKINIKTSMAKAILVVAIMLISCMESIFAYTQNTDKIPYPGGKAFFYRLYLVDKELSDYSLDRPYEFLSPKAIERRSKQHLSVDSTDLPVSTTYRNAIANAGLHIVGTSHWHNTILIKAASRDVESVIETIPFVSRSEMVFETPDSIMPTHRKTFHESMLPSPLVNDKSPLHGAADIQISAAGGKQLHEQGYRGKGMTIAVLDGGFMNVDRIPAFKKVNIVGMRNFVDDGCNSIFDDIDHGTKVLSTMAINEPNIFVGTAPEARYLLLRSEDYKTESHVEEDYWTMAAEYADSMGVDIINSSLGYHRFDDDTRSSAYKYSQLDGKSTFISQSASLLARKGIILVNSAGNEGIMSWKKINFPADAYDILSIGAMSPDSINAAFSSIGPTADGRVKPDVMAVGAPAAIVNGKGTILEEMGTSFASPIVCGLVACLWQAFPNKTAIEIMDMIRNNASQHDMPDNIFGYGIANFDILPTKQIMVGNKSSLSKPTLNNNK